MCFLDLKGAYDRVPRQLLWHVLERLGVQGGMLSAIKSLYDNFSVAVQVGGRVGSALRSHTGLKQGCPLSPILFGLFADGLHRHLMDCCAGSGLMVGNSEAFDLAYADDFALVSATPDGLQRTIDAVAAFCQLTTMEISVEKTKVLVARGGVAAPAVAWTCLGAPLQQVQRYKYLGLEFDAAHGFQQALPILKQRMWAGWATIKRQYGQLRCGASVWLHQRLYEACVLPSASYGCELWSPYKWPGKRELEQAHLHFLRQICNVRRAVPTAILFRELDSVPLQHHWLTRVAGFWNALAALPDRCLHKRLALDACDAFICHNASNWARGVYNALRAVDYQLTIRRDAIEPIHVSTLRSKIADKFNAHWSDVHVCPRTCPCDRYPGTRPGIRSPANFSR